jgi:3-oxoacyl-[acyl-carrier-protein] synthase II
VNGLTVDFDVVVTGRGALTAAGPSVAHLLRAVSDGVSRLGPARTFGDPRVIRGPVGEVGLAADSEVSRLRAVAMALHAAEEALLEANIPSGGRRELDVVLGTGSGSRGPEDWRLAGLDPPLKALEDGSERFDAVTVSVCKELGALGRSVTVSTGCSSGANAVAHGWELLRTGRSQRVLCLGVEELWAGLVLSFGMIGALSTETCAPFDRSDGTTLAEGVAAVVLEHRVTAHARNAPYFGVVMSAAQSADAFHLTRPDPSGGGAELAVRRALQLAQVGTGSVDVVSTHGTGTAANDEAERTLQARLFSHEVPMIATKGVHGHTHGASAIVELLVLLECLRGTSRPTPVSINSVHPSSMHKNAVKWRIGVKNAYAIGGLNTSLVAASASANVRRPQAPLHRVFSAAEYAVVGSGYIASANSQCDVDAMMQDKTGIVHIPVPLTATTQDSRAVSGRAWRRLDLLAKLALVATSAILEPFTGLDRENVGVSYATKHGPIMSWFMASDALRHGRAINPAMIPRLSFNAAPSLVCERLQLRGATSAYASGHDGAMHALMHAVMTLELGLAEAMIVLAVDEYTGVLSEDRGLARLGGIDPTSPVFKPVHDRAADPWATPSVAALLLVRADADAMAREDTARLVEIPSAIFDIRTASGDRRQSAASLFIAAERVGELRSRASGSFT